MSHYPSGVTTRTIDSLCKDGDSGDSGACCICRRPLDYDAERGFWRFDEIYGEPAQVVSIGHGDHVCGPRCHSQYVFNNSTEAERQDMRLMAQICEAWLKIEYNRRQWSFWSYSQLDLKADLLNQEMNSLLAAFGMEDGENPPAWYIAAGATPAKPTLRAHPFSATQPTEVCA
jgi:hypothetical protein